MKKKKSFWKTLWKKVKMLNFFHARRILISFNSHISVVVCSFPEFGTVSKWCRLQMFSFSRSSKVIPGLDLTLARTNSADLDFPKFKAYTDNNLNMVQLDSLVIQKENIVLPAFCQHFLLFL